ncbi:zinc knuckle-domain-containing protein [Flagelloscypha sp. PMI_526]|nr:zinc knuckle-domain-containing protein [Flagelloscypha sp. PMI_526]
MSKYAPHARGSNNPRATASTVCQKCLGTGHFIYQCKSTRPYVSRPSRSEQLEKPSVLAKLKKEGKPSVEVPEEFKRTAGTADQILEKREKERKEKERASKRRKEESSSEDDSDSDSSSSESSSSSSDSSSTSSRSRERDEKRRVPEQRRSPSLDSDDSRGRRR